MSIVGQEQLYLKTGFLILFLHCRFHGKQESVDVGTHLGISQVDTGWDCVMGWVEGALDDDA